MSINKDNNLKDLFTYVKNIKKTTMYYKHV